MVHMPTKRKFRNIDAMNVSQRFPWQIQPGLEQLLPLARDILLAERAVVEHGPDITSGNSPKHHVAWNVLKERRVALSVVPVLCEQCIPEGTFSSEHC